MRTRLRLFSGALFCALVLPVLPVLPVMAEETAELSEVSAAEAGVSAAEAAAATAEATTEETVSGTLIEIGNTTAEETTMIIRTTDDGVTTDETIQITAATAVETDTGTESDLSDWIAGDQVTMTVSEGENSGEMTAKRLRNRSFKAMHRGRNGFVKAVRADANELDVEWAGKVYTLDTAKAKLVAGAKNPAALADFQVGDRIRARVTNDQDGNDLTWDASIVVVLRRGNTLFMRVTRWVVPAQISALPGDTGTLPYVITAKVLDSKFYEKGDVNNLIGAPGTEIKIQVDDKTKLVRRFRGRARIDEFMEGDKIRVVGRLNEETGNLDAGLIKNNSIQALGVAQTVSEVVSVDTAANKLIVTPVGARNPLTGKRVRVEAAKEWTIQLRSDAKLVENGAAIALGDIAAGDIVRVRGVANRAQRFISANALSVVTEKLAAVAE